MIRAIKQVSGQGSILLDYLLTRRRSTYQKFFDESRSGETDYPAYPLTVFAIREENLRLFSKDLFQKFFKLIPGLLVGLGVISDGHVKLFCQGVGFRIGKAV